MTTATAARTEQEIDELLEEWEEGIWEEYRLQLVQRWARANQEREPKTTSPFNAWETFHSGWTPATCEGFNASGRVPVLKVKLSKRQCEVLCDALNRREAWATVWLAEHRTNRSSV